jgi:hypothetical protein
MRVIYTTKRNVEKVWGVRYTLGALYLSKNTVIILFCVSLLPEAATVFQENTKSV